jgi:hypothetical protein
MDKLFDLPEAMEREHRIASAKTGTKWGGIKSKKARDKCRSMLPWACRKCGGEIPAGAPEASWQAGHREDRMDGGNEDGIEPEHSHCNMSAGGKRGAAITNGQKLQQVNQVPIDRENEPQWW